MATIKFQDLVIQCLGGGVFLDKEVAERVSAILEREIPTKTVTGWRNRGIPEDTFYRVKTEVQKRRGELRVTEEPAPFNDEDLRQLPLWQREEWRNRRRLSKCGKQLLKMFYRTGCKGKTWDFIEMALNEAEDWSEDDWKDLHDEGWDMALEGAERLRKAEEEG